MSDYKIIECMNVSSSFSLPRKQEEKNVHRLTYDGKEIIIIGTAHISKESADLVERVITYEKPDTVCVELCPMRFEALKRRDQWKDMDIVRVIREKRTSLLLSQLLLASLQKKMAQKFNINPGEDMLRAVAKAEEIKSEIVLADREIRITLLRTWRRMRFISKVKLLPEMLLSLFITEDITEEDFDRVLRVNAKSVYLTARALVPGMKTRGAGAILNIASTAGVSPRPRLNWYNASKGWMITATKAMAVELAPFGIRVNALNPVAGETPLLKSFMGEDTPEIRAKFLATIPLGRFSTPEDMGNAACFLCSDEASMITGVAMEVDGGRCV